MHHWVGAGYLFPTLPRVYSVGHHAPSVEGDLAAALLYAGPGAALSHATAAWWLGLLEQQPRNIHVSTPRQPRSLPGIKIHGRRQVERILHKGLATTALPQTYLDLAVTEPLRTVRKALASADYQGLLDLEAVEAELGRGRPGTNNLRAALEAHRPQLAHTKSGLEALLLELCEQHDLPLPDVNVRVAGWEVDALWREAGLAVELDGYGNHHTPAQLKRDRAKEMALRAAGLTAIRYSAEQLAPHQRAATIEELLRLTSR